ncbi:MAG: transglutaminase family protein [Fuerstiella sp.]|nr:transglutaminase family protein [Fuerstiella sp.]MCP4786488.1 transglutaminase family protein [Fuerstiella sp.]MCP4858353.1 transglutaminase family protein [Fuerstiella sp.]
MTNTSLDPADYLQCCEVIDWQTPSVLRLSSTLAGDDTCYTTVAKRCFDWVRDNIRHSLDYQLNPVTCRASDVLTHRTGYCYAKSHLLSALLRANQIPAGLCYQRLSVDGMGPPFCLHGMTAVFLPDIGWYRSDPRGNRDDVDAQFTPPLEQLAFRTTLQHECDLPDIHRRPLAVVVDALQTHNTWDALLANLPDVSQLS